MSSRIALIPGDGVGPEVVAEARKVVDASGATIDWTPLPWGSEHWHRTGSMMPPDGAERLRDFDAVLLGAVGHPSVPDHVSLWGLLLPVRQRLDLWANLRPVRLLEGIPTPLAGRGPADVDMLFLRENTEGEYSGIGGRAHAGLDDEVALETSVFTRGRLERFIRLGFAQARGRRGHLTNVTKSNASRHGYVLWDEVVEEVAADFDDVRVERALVDAFAAQMVQRPESIDVVISSNLFGDILTDLGAAIQGGMGMAASASVDPESGGVGVFEPVHGSAPDIAGRGVANPMAAIWSAALMLRHVGEVERAERVQRALEDVCREGPRTPDCGSDGTTGAVGDAVAERARG